MNSEKKHTKNYQKIIETYIESKGTQKMWNYFLEITKKENFIEAIMEIRRKYKMPDNGFPNDDNCYKLPPDNLSGGNDCIENIRDEIVNKICKKYKLHYFDYSEVLINFVCYNDFFPIYELGACGLFRISDVILEKEEPFGELFQQGDDMAYPIAIKISPYASQRDLIDFVKNKSVWKEQIEFLQNKYRDKNIKIGKVKSKNAEIQERNEFIYKNRDKTLKQIRKLVADKDKFAKKNRFLDDGHIAKIISLEKQRRKDM